MFSKSCMYAIRAVLYLAIHTDDQTKLGVEDLAEALDLPKHFLGKILQQLARNKLVSSSKGRNGGFYLHDQNKNSSIIRIVDVIDGPDALISCVLGLPSCSHANPCPFHHSIQEMRATLRIELENETIAKTADRIQKDNLTFKIEQL